MAEFQIKEEEFASLKGKVVVITGCSSGIGLGTTELLLECGAKVVGGDLNSSPTEHKDFAFIKTNVTEWKDLLALFNRAKEFHNRIDHVFSNAGISGRANYLEEKFDPNGELEEPSTLTLDINLKAMINTSYLGLYHFRHQEPPGGSIVCTASASSFQRFRVCDYTTAKHGVIGWMRGMIPNLTEAKLPIRINAISPSWTLTGLVPKDLLEKMGQTEAGWQSPMDVAKSVAILMADEARQGQLIYSWTGRYMEIEEEILLPAGKMIVGGQGDDMVIAKLQKLAEGIGYS